MKEYLKDGTFMVVMGDLLTDADLSSIIKQHKDKKALASIAVKQVDDVTRFGIVVRNEDGFITEFQEKPKVEDALSDLASTGIYILEPEVFLHMPETGEFGFGRQLFPQLVEKGLPVLGIEMAKGTYWSDVGAIPQYLESNFDVLDKNVKLCIEGDPKNGTSPAEKSACGRVTGEGTKIDETAKIDGILMTGKNCVIGANARLTGHVILGDDCVVEEGASLSDCLVWSNSKIGKGSQLKNTVVASNCTVEPNSQHEKTALVPDSAATKPLASSSK